MAGYTRQSVADIINGAEITAPPLNAEFNQLSSAFNGTTGHAHDGSTGNGPKINLNTSISGYLPAAHGGVGGKNNLSAVTTPTITDDASQGYAPGSMWEDTTTGRIYICVGNTTGAATWRELVQVTLGNAILPASHNTVDLGDVTTRFQDLYLGGGIAAAGNVSIGGTLSLLGSTSLQALTAASATVSGLSTLATADINGGTIDGTVIGATTPSAVTGTNITATTGFAGNLTGNVTGNVTGNLTGNVTGNVTGNLTGNVTSSGTSTFNNVTIDGTLNMNAGTTATITNLSTPVNSTDAATKGYVDTSISNLVDAAPGALNTLNELAAALGDDPNFSATVTTSIASKLPLSGGTMTGSIAMGGNKVTGLGTPASAADAATKSYVDAADALKLNLTGGTMSGNIAMGGSKVTGLGTPTATGDAATKSYVDSILGSSTSAATSAANAAVSETNAAASAVSAASSAASALSAYDSFDDRYLGAKSSAPTLDNDGNALVTGALYFNSVLGYMHVWTGSAWIKVAPDLVGDTTPQLGGNLETNGNNVLFGDNNKAIFGAGSDLQIYHDGSNSRIYDTGTGDLRIQGTNLRLQDAQGENFLYAVQDGSVTLYYDNAAKLATTSTGVDVTGTVTADGLTVGGTEAAFGGASGEYKIIIEGSAAPRQNYIGMTGYDSLVIAADEDNLGTLSDIQFRVDAKQVAAFSAGGDISFYEDTGTTPKFFWDASEESLTIGAVVNPQVPLNVSAATVGSSNAIAFLRNSSVDGNGLVVDVTNTPTDYVADFRIGNSSKVRIDSSGRVGIGTTSPALQSAGQGLHIHGATNSEIKFTNTTTGSVATDGTALVANGSNFTINNREAGNLQFNTNNTERMRIDASGNVGIGTSSPSAALDVTSTGTRGARITRSLVSPSNGTYALEVDNTAQTANVTAAGALKVTNNNGSGLSIDGKGDVSLYDDSGSAKFFWDASAERLGIGATSPSASLHITNGSSTHVYLIGSSGDPYGLWVDPTGAEFTLGSWGNGARIKLSDSSEYITFGTGVSSNERMRITSSGNVGIGTSSPVYKLVVSSGGASGIEFAPAYSGTANLVQHYSRSGGVYVDAVNDAAQHRFNIGGSEKVRIDSSGRVGIGTSSPDAALRVSSGSDLQARFSNVDGRGLAIKTFTSAGTTNNGVIYDAGVFSDAQHVWHNGGTERMRINSSGNVGIGTSSPSVTLDVVGVGGGNGEFALSRTSGATLFGQAQAALGRFGTSTNHNLQFITNNSGRMTITTAGNVGIGTSSPDGNLTVGSTTTSGDISIRIKGDATSRGFLMFGDAGGAQLGDIMYDHSTDHMRFRVNNAERMRIDSSGNVGIGSTNPQSALDLAEGAQGRGITWAGSNGSTRYNNIFSSYSGAGLVLSSMFHGSTSADSYVTSHTGTTRASGIRLNWTNNNGIQFFTDTAAAKTAGDAFVPSERMRIDSSGNLLVGTTSTTTSTVGFKWRQDLSRLLTVADGGSSASFGRLTSDGDIVLLQKDGTTVGSIASRLGVVSSLILDPRAGGAGLTGGGPGAIIPTGNTGASTDGATDLGNSTGRWKDLYLSGGVYLGGTGAANLLDDYEEGTWTPTITGTTSGSVAVSVFEATYTKIGDTIRLSCYLNGIDMTTSTVVGQYRISGLPFTGDPYSDVASVTFCNIFSFDESSTSISGYCNGSHIMLFKGSSVTSVTNSDTSTATNGQIMLSITYKV